MGASRPCLGTCVGLGRSILCAPTFVQPILIPRTLLRAAAPAIAFAFLLATGAEAACLCHCPEHGIPAPSSGDAQSRHSSHHDPGSQSSDSADALCTCVGSCQAGASVEEPVASGRDECADDGFPEPDTSCPAEGSIPVSQSHPFLPFAIGPPVA